MTTELPPCPICSSTLTYHDGVQFVCPECAHEWSGQDAAAADADDVAVASIFVNPTQFAPNEDFDKYPRTWDDDLTIAKAAGIQAIYAPKASSMYPPDYSTYVTVEGVSEGLCSLTRPHFFRGVAITGVIMTGPM
mgnify:CR=1 FL=1